MGLFPDAGRSPGGAHWRTLGEEFRAHGAWRPSLLAFEPTSLGTRPRVGTLTGQQVGRRLPPGAIIPERWARSFRKAGRNHFGRVGAIISECRAPSSRNRGRDHSALPGDIARNLQPIARTSVTDPETQRPTTAPPRAVCHTNDMAPSLMAVQITAVTGAAPK